MDQHQVLDLNLRNQSRIRNSNLLCQRNGKVSKPFSQRSSIFVTRRPLPTRVERRCGWKERGIRTRGFLQAHHPHLLKPQLVEVQAPVLILTQASHLVLRNTKSLNLSVRMKSVAETAPPTPMIPMQGRGRKLQMLIPQKRRN